MTNQATRIIIKAAGELALSSPGPTVDLEQSPQEDIDSVDVGEDEKEILQVASEQVVDLDIETYRPQIRVDRLWNLSELDLGMWNDSTILPRDLVNLDVEWIADGCGVLGTGGGGSPYPPFLVARQLLREGKEILVSAILLSHVGPNVVGIGGRLQGRSE